MPKCAINELNWIHFGVECNSSNLTVLACHCTRYLKVSTFIISRFGALEHFNARSYLNKQIQCSISHYGVLTVKFHSCFLCSWFSGNSMAALPSARGHHLNSTVIETLPHRKTGRPKLGVCFRAPNNPAILLLLFQDRDFLKCLEETPSLIPTYR